MTVDDQTDPGAWYRPASVHVEQYDENWPTLYRIEAAMITAATGSHFVEIEHIGSTAIPGMPAKPIVDILAAVTSWERFDELVECLSCIGYRYTPESEGDDRSRRVFRKGPDDMRLLRTHHLHVTESGSSHWGRLVGFRDQLRDSAADAAAYVALKRRLAEQFSNDSRSYTQGKADFVRGVEAKRDEFTIGDIERPTDDAAWPTDRVPQNTRSTDGPG